MERYDINDHDCLCRRGVLCNGKIWYNSIAQNPSSTETVVVVYIISFHCTEPLFYRDSRGRLYHIFPLHRTPLLQRQSWSLISYLSIAQNPSSTGTVVVVYIISFHCTEPLCYRDSCGHLYHIFPLHRTPMQGAVKCIAYNFFCRDGIYFDKILVSEYKLFKRSNKANLFIALVQ
jgi:hypothetical protein